MHGQVSNDGEEGDDYDYDDDGGDPFFGKPATNLAHGQISNDDEEGDDGNDDHDVQLTILNSQASSMGSSILWALTGGDSEWELFSETDKMSIFCSF